MKIFLTFWMILICGSSISQSKIIRDCKDENNGISYYLIEPNNYFVQFNSHQYKSRIKHLGNWQIANNSLILNDKEDEKKYNSYNIEGVTIYVYDTVTFNFEVITKEIQYDLYNHEIYKMLGLQDSIRYELIKLRILLMDILPEKFCSKEILIQYPYELWNQEKWNLRKIRKLEKRNSRINKREKK